MQKMTLVRLGLATVIASAGLAGVSAAGCSSDDSTTPGGDSGAHDSSMGVGDGGGSDTGKPGEGGGGDGGDAGPMKPNPKVYLVNAAVSPLSNPIRFCFGLGDGTNGAATTVAGGINPFPDFKVSPQAPVAGLPNGFGGSTASSASLSSFNLAILGTISVYAIDATKIANETNMGGTAMDGGELACEDIIGGDGLGKTGPMMKGTLTMGTDYWYVGTIQNGALVAGGTYLAALVGCPPGEPVDEAPFCSTASFAYDTAKGNLSLKVWSLDNASTVDGGAIGAQVAHASVAWDTVVTLQHAGGTAAGFFTTGTTTTDGGAEAGDDGGGNDGATEAGDDGGGTDAGDDGGGGDGGTGAPTINPQMPIADPIVFGDLKPMTLASQGGIDYATSGFYAALTDMNGMPLGLPGTILPLPLTAIDQLTYGSSVPMGGSFKNGAGYVFILVGDPLDPSYINPQDGGPGDPQTGVFNGKSAHFLGFPTSNP